MKKPFLNSVFLLCVLSFHSTPTSARSVTLGVSFSIPPYVIVESNSGLELDIIKRAFDITGYKVVPKYVPLARSFQLYENHQLDGVVNVKQGMVKGYYSTDVITFQNCAITLDTTLRKIKSTADLKGMRVVAFQNANRILGEGFHGVIEGFASYREVARQVLQINMLFLNKADVVIMDKNIFDYYRKQVHLSNELPASIFSRRIVYQCIFEPAKYKLAFHNEKIRDDFNKGLKIIRENGIYKAIQHSYKAVTAPVRP